MERHSIALDDPFFFQGDEALQRIHLAQAEHVASSGPPEPAAPVTLDSFEEFKCRSCGTTLMSQHLLNLHISEAHDPFFEAQVAKRSKVYQCLVEGCEKAFGSIMDRKKHLVDYHLWPSNYAFDKLHVGKRQAQHRPSTAFQKAEGGRAKQVALAGVGSQSQVQTNDTNHPSLPVDQAMDFDMASSRPLGKPMGHMTGHASMTASALGATDQISSTNTKEMEGLSQSFARLVTGQPRTKSSRSSNVKL